MYQRISKTIIISGLLLLPMLCGAMEEASSSSSPTRTIEQSLSSVDLSTEKPTPLSIGKLKKLETLNLSGNSVEELPESIGDLENLKNLNLDSNQLKKVPDQISKLTKLESLSLVFTWIYRLPKNFENLINLKSLNLRQTGLGAGTPENSGKHSDLNWKLYSLSNDIRSFQEKTPEERAAIFVENPNILTEITKKIAEFNNIQSQLNALNLASNEAPRSKLRGI